MKRHTILTSAVAVFCTLVLGCSCCCGGDADKKSGCAAGNCPPNAVKKAATPDGGVIYIVAVWNADATGPDGKTTCQTAQCWQTADGKTLCAKPLKECPKAAAANGQCFQTTDGKTMTAENAPAAVVGKPGPQTWAVKEVKPCPANGKAPCKAPEHVTMPGNKHGCAPADVKHASEAKADIPAPLQEGFAETDYFVAYTD